jgi:hypothetical protein
MGASPTSTHAAEGLDLRKAARRGAGFLAVLVLGVVALQACPASATFASDSQALLQRGS